jgi:DNA-binding ferritin-like protein
LDAQKTKEKNWSIQGYAMKYLHLTFEDYIKATTDFIAIIDDRLSEVMKESAKGGKKHKKTTKTSNKQNT